MILLARSQCLGVGDNYHRTADRKCQNRYPFDHAYNSLVYRIELRSRIIFEEGSFWASSIGLGAGWGIQPEIEY
jgi:hypothetical protein